MIWSKFFQPEVTVKLPRALNADTMFVFVESVIDEQRGAMAGKVNFDFENLDFIEPVGVVILSNLCEYLKTQKVEARFGNHTRPTVALKFLDDSGFFYRYTGRQVFADSAMRPTTMPLNRINKARAQEYLRSELMPWIGKMVGLSPDSIDSVRASLEEILHNVADHSEVDYGCTFAQHFPRKEIIQIAISDFGRGIPDVVRTKVPDISDTYALRLACKEGFTTKSNVQNRGAGLPNLMRYVTQRNEGNVLLVSGRASLTASLGQDGKTKITPRRARGIYPGTLVRVILRTNTLERAVRDAEQESFQW